MIGAKSTLDTVLVKAPHRRETFSEQELKEFAKCADPVTGPIYFMDHFFHIQHPVKGKMLYHPFEYQRRLIENYHTNRFSISLMPRQTGKSTSAAGYLLWYAMFKPDSTILIAAHKYLGAQEIMQRIRYAYELCPNHIRAGATSYNKGSIEFDNGSRIVAQTTTENTGRGMAITMLYLDEFAFVRPNIAEEFWTSITPTLSTGGKAIITSTPNSDEDQFAMIWKGANKTEDEYGVARPDGTGINGFKAYRAFWREHPDRDEAWASEQRAQLGEERFRREMDCEFIINDETLINPLKLVEMEGIEPRRKTGPQVRWYRPINKDMMYIVALDPSLGTGGDPAAIQVFEAETTEQVAEWRHNKTDVPTQINIMADIIKEINSVVKNSSKIYYSVENNTLGEAALISIREYGEENIEGYFLSDNSTQGAHGHKIRKGFTTTSKSKLVACNKFKTLIESGRMKVYSKPLITELKGFIAARSSYEAKQGETDDLVMASLLATRMLMVLQTYHSELDAHLKDHTDNIVEPFPFIVMFG